MSRDPLTHMLLVAANTRAFCGVKVDRHTRWKVAPQNASGSVVVTCIACLDAALRFHEVAAEGIRRARILAVTCPACEAEPGKPCHSLSKRWQNPASRTVGVGDNGWRKTPHAERVRAVDDRALCYCNGKGCDRLHPGQRG